MNQERISVFGLGKLGCTMLACFASKGWKVMGVDVNETHVNKVNSGESPIYEPRVDGLIKDFKDNISATLDSRKAILETDISFVIVPTPSQRDGSFSIKYVEAVAAEIGSILREKKDYHVVVITSTVLPGDMHNIVNFLEKTSGKKVSQDFGVCYNPDFIALGTIVRDFLNPDMVLIGESDEKAGSYLENIHHNLTDNTPNIHRMNFVNAELSKISLNSFCTLKITFANVLAEICENMPGGDSDVVTQAIGQDSRIGTKYLKGGLSFGGPCFPRDNRAFSFSAAKFGCKTPLAEKTDEINNYQRNERIPGVLLKLLNKKGSNKICLLGLTYKGDTTLVEEAAPISIIKTLVKEGVEITAFDPAGMDEAKTVLSDIANVNFADSAKECIKGQGICFIGTPWKEFKELTKNDFVDLMESPIIFDGWSLYHFDSDNKLEYIEIGKSNQ